MAVYSKQFLSGSTNGRPIEVTGTAPSQATMLHTSVSGSAVAEMDEVHVYAYNTAAAGKDLYIRHGASATGQPINEIKYVMPPAGQGLHVVIPGLPLNAANTVQAYATAAGNIACVGWVNRVT